MRVKRFLSFILCIYCHIFCFLLYLERDYLRLFSLTAENYSILNRSSSIFLIFYLSFIFFGSKSKLRSFFYVFIVSNFFFYCTLKETIILFCNCRNLFHFKSFLFHFFKIFYLSIIFFRSESKQISFFYFMYLLSSLKETIIQYKSFLFHFFLMLYLTFLSFTSFFILCIYCH